MNKLCLTFLFCLYLSSAIKGQEISHAETVQVQNTIVEAFRLFSELDTSFLRRHYTEDITILEQGVVWNRDSIIKIVLQPKPKNFRRTNHFEFLETNINGNQAWVSYRNSAEIVSGEKSFLVRWLESAVLVKTGDHWKIRLLHSTRMEQFPGGKRN